VQQVAELRGKEVEQIVGRRLANIYRRSDGSTASSSAETTSSEAPK
jgi:hypothetical protein